MNVSPPTSTDGSSPSPDPHPTLPSTDEPSWEWSALFDFSIDDSSVLPWDPDPTPPPPSPMPLQPPPPANPRSEKVRKRDRRLTCENFLAGRMPCSCPEMDEKEDEEEAAVAAAGTKRARRAEAEVGARCQVPGCEADIRELKGYHRRHRVCLHCANASTVMLGGQAMRYCQQCGKFHVLSDFDEGKRSCRRKLEKHNNRRRRKLVDVRNVAEKEPRGIFQADDATCNNEILLDADFTNGVASTTENQSLSGQPKNAEVLIESEDGHGSAFSLVPHVQNIHSNSVASFVTSCETLTDEGKDYSKPSVPALSSSFGNKCAYSSVCPTGRMSFKLYDWNPAEFPRRLRHQIFQWLASMPIELEGYIRPGCTILTLFIAMPRVMWTKLSRDAFIYLSALVNAPGGLLSGRSMMRISLDDMMFQVLKDGTSLVKAKMEARVPRLHYAHPTCFEAGKPIEFVVCGNNLFQPKFRPLVSFAGKYLVHESCLIPGKKARSVNVIDSESTDGSGHEMFKIYIPSTESKLFGPAFIEVENVSGLSNFIPVLIGDTELCSELQLVEQRFSKILDLKNIPNSCQSFVLKQISTKELLSDVAWLLKGPQLDKNEILFTSLQIQRLNCLLGFLIQNNCIIALQRIMQSYGNLIEASWLFESSSKINDADIMLFQKYVNQAREIIQQKPCASETSVAQLATCSQMFFLAQNDVKHGVLYGIENTNRGIDGRMEDRQLTVETSVSQQNDVYVPLVKKEIVMDVDNYKYLEGLGWPKRACSQILSSSITRSHVTVLSVTAIAVCFGLCVALNHPHEVKIFAASIRRCLFGTSRL